MSATIVSPRSTNRLSSVTVSAAPSEPMSLSNCAPVRPQMSDDSLPHRRRGCVLIAGEIAVEESGIANEDVVGVELIGFAAEAADRLQPEREMRFGLSATALDLFVGRAVCRQMRD